MRRRAIVILMLSSFLCSSCDFLFQDYVVPLLPSGYYSIRIGAWRNTDLLLTEVSGYLKVEEISREEYEEKEGKNCFYDERFSQTEESLYHSFDWYTLEGEELIKQDFVSRNEGGIPKFYSFQGENMIELDVRTIAMNFEGYYFSFFSSDEDIKGDLVVYEKPL